MSTIFKIEKPNWKRFQSVKYAKLISAIEQAGVDLSAIRYRIVKKTSLCGTYAGIVYTGPKDQVNKFNNYLWSRFYDY
jgi:hypothetical protein